MRIIKAITAGMVMFASVRSVAQTSSNWNYIGMEDVVSKDSVTKKGFTLIFLSKDTAFSNTIKERMIDAFFKVYPVQAKLYNQNTLKKVIFVIDPAYSGVAATSGSIVRYNPGWFARNPGDIDVVTHEVMHIIQSYPNWAGPGWITEGIADYVRYTLGVDNEGANWSLPDFNTAQKYTDAYRVTARFFVWLEKNNAKGIVKKLDAAMRSNSYNEAFWKTNTGKTADEWWTIYAKNPVI